MLTSSSTWSGSMFKSKTPYGPPSPPTSAVGMSSYGPPSPPTAAAGISSYGPPSPPTAAGGMSSYGPPSPPRAVVGISSYGPPSPAAGTLRSRWPTSPCTAMAPAASVGMSPSSKSGGLLRSNLMDGSRRVKD